MSSEIRIIRVLIFSALSFFRPEQRLIPRYPHRESV